MAPGPDLGACADTPEGVFRFGEAGIGTCLAGPADLSFFGQDGGQFLAVVNADPYREFRSGSLLVLDWDDLDARLRDGPPERIFMDEVRAFPFEMLDDDDGDGVGNNPFFGGFGYVPSSQVAVLPSRLSEDGILRAGRDEAFVVDLQRMELPGGGIELLGALELEDDPQPVITDPATDRVYVGNLTDHSISVLTSRPPEGARLPLAEIDVATDAGTTAADFDDADASSSFAEMTQLSIGIPEDLVEDDFLLTYVDASIRLFVPTPVGDGDVVGVQRYGSGGQEYVPTAFGPEQFFDETGTRGTGGTIGDPFVQVDGDGVTTMWFSRPDGTIWRAAQSLLAGEWITEPTSVHSGGLHRSPSAAPLREGLGLFTERVDSESGTSGIHLAVAPDGATFTDEGLVLQPEDGLSFEQPFAVFDPSGERFRMWLTVRDGDRTTIALSESTTGTGGWSDPQTVMSLASGSVAAPSVAVLDGRYGMWFAVSDGTRWDHAFAWSYDGVHWTTPDVVAPSDVPFDPTRAPRAAVLAQRTGAWRVSSATGGELNSLLPAGLDEPVPLVGLELAVASGHELPNHVVPRQAAELGLFPGSAVATGAGRTRVFTTAIGPAGRPRLAVFDVGGPSSGLAGAGVPTWTLLTDPMETEDELGLRPSEAISHPVAVDTGEGWVVFATLSDRLSARLVRLTSDDGLHFDPLDRTPLLRGETASDWDRAGQYAGSVEVVDGRVHLWYTGDDGSRQAIGSARADDVRGRFVREAGVGADFRFGTGLPGSFDDTAVADPLVVDLSGETHLYYAGFDGSAWHLGHAVRDGAGFVRRTDPDSRLSVAAMHGSERTFSALGVSKPVLFGQDDDGLVLLYAGEDGTGRRIGRARVTPDAADAVSASQRFPTAGDTLAFGSTRGLRGAEVIELGQATQWYTAFGIGMSSMTLDADRGFVYVTSKLEDNLYVVDVRDDSDGAFADTNHLDLESYVRVESGSLGGGYRDAALSRSRSLLYLSQRNPEALLAIDLTRIVDDATKAPTDSVVEGVIPMADAAEDLGPDSLGLFGGAGMAMSADEHLLLVTHFRQNAVSVFDLDVGPIGEEIAWIPWVGENPTIVRISPDQRWAVVGNYVGEVVDNMARSTLAVIDLDPASDRYLEVVTWLANQ